MHNHAQHIHSSSSAQLAAQQQHTLLSGRNTHPFLTLPSHVHRALKTMSDVCGGGALAVRSCRARRASPPGRMIPDIVAKSPRPQELWTTSFYCWHFEDDIQLDECYEDSGECTLDNCYYKFSLGAPGPPPGASEAGEGGFPVVARDYRRRRVGSDHCCRYRGLLLLQEEEEEDAAVAAGAHHPSTRKHEHAATAEPELEHKPATDPQASLPPASPPAQVPTMGATSEMRITFPLAKFLACTSCRRTARSSSELEARSKM